MTRFADGKWVEEHMSHVVGKVRLSELACAYEEVDFEPRW